MPWKSVLWPPSCCTRTARRIDIETDVTKLILAFRSFANAANKLESMKQKLTAAYLKHYSIICLEKLKKNTKSCCQMGRWKRTCAMYRYYNSIFLEWLRKTTKTVPRWSGVSTQIRSTHKPVWITSLNACTDLLDNEHYTNPSRQIARGTKLYTPSSNIY
jgi:hypothetical protein